MKTEFTNDLQYFYVYEIGNWGGQMSGVMWSDVGGDVVTEIV